ncbi:inactive rhomboid protein 1-like isoform X2 [Dysidea avara]|uniref:inactive rhomboid protein 1-like isoform X2 n=1 Tax=Dysidea avara TaxID=196820 RepID=UPI003324DA82
MTDTQDDFCRQYWEAICKGHLRDSLRLTGKAAKRFAMWLFGFEPGDGEDKWRKWQARQKVLRANEDRPAPCRVEEDDTTRNADESDNEEQNRGHLIGVQQQQQEVMKTTAPIQEQQTTKATITPVAVSTATVSYIDSQNVSTAKREVQQKKEATKSGGSLMPRPASPLITNEAFIYSDVPKSNGATFTNELFTEAATQLDNYSTASPQYDSVSSDESSVHNATSLECPREDEIKLTTVVRKSASISFSEKTNSPEMEVKTVSEETTDDDGATVLPDRPKGSQEHRPSLNVIQKVIICSRKHLRIKGTLLHFKYRCPKEDKNQGTGTGSKDFYEHLFLFTPWFTIWISFIHILVMIVVTSIYGLAPYGCDFKTETDLIQRGNLGRERVQRTISTSVWGGLSQEDLILLGARYAPCMRRDRELFDLIEEDRITESQSGCCIRNDRPVCIQVNNQSECNSIFLRFLQNDTTANPSGVVCGQSPRTCASPISQEPRVWNNDITRWPRCRNSNPPTTSLQDAHLSCDIIGRPCCIGILAKCVIASLEYCNYMKGRYHEEAFLCSQVDCLRDTCGLISFVNEHEPDQFYRVWISLFLHGGWIHLLFTLIFNILVLGDVEMLIGWFPVSVIYLGSGFAGNIFGAIVIPYRPEVGPAGSIMGVMAAVLVYVVWEWKKFLYPKLELSKVLLIIVFFFCLGMFPYVDNFAHLGGLIGGLLLSAMVVPFYSLFNGDLSSGHKQVDQLKLILIIICAPLFAIFYGALFIIFYEAQPNCYICQYLTCIPFSDTICQDQRPTPDHRDVDLVI